MFSKACEYGIKASIYIAEQSLSDKKVSLKEVAKSINSPEAYTSKILQKLSKNNIIRAEKGPRGGFSIDILIMEKIKLSSIVDTIDGNSIYTGCGLGLAKCNSKKPCPVHDQFVIIRNELKRMLETTSLKTVVTGLNNGLTFLKR